MKKKTKDIIMQLLTFILGGAVVAVAITSGCTIKPGTGNYNFNSASEGTSVSFCGCGCQEFININSDGPSEIDDYSRSGMGSGAEVTLEVPLLK